MSRSVTGVFKEDPQVLLDKLTNWATKNDIDFQGDLEKGYVNSKGFYVEYLVDGLNYTLTVSKKPGIVPWAFVEATLNKIANPAA